MDALQSLLDRQAITDLIYRYCRAVDRLDTELGYSIWHTDAQADYCGVYNGDGRGFIDFVCEKHRSSVGHSHQVTNILIELDGDKAASEAYTVSAMQFKQDRQLKQITTWARYIDQWSRRDGRWAIDKRVTVRDLAEMRDVGVPLSPERSMRDKSDPSYAVLRGPF